jgi:hypothetical protein
MRKSNKSMSIPVATVDERNSNDLDQLSNIYTSIDTLATGTQFHKAIIVSTARESTTQKAWMKWGTELGLSKVELHQQKMIGDVVIAGCGRMDNLGTQIGNNLVSLIISRFATTARDKLIRLYRLLDGGPESMIAFLETNDLSLLTREEVGVAVDEWIASNGMKKKKAGRKKANKEPAGDLSGFHAPILPLPDLASEAAGMYMDAGKIKEAANTREMDPVVCLKAGVAFLQIGFEMLESAPPSLFNGNGFAKTLREMADFSSSIHK